MTYQPGDLSAIQATLANHMPVSAEDFTAFLTADRGANYCERNFNTLVEMMIDSMPGERRFDAAIQAYRLAPTSRNKMGDVSFLEIARDAVEYLPESRHQAAKDQLVFCAPRDSAFYEEMTGLAPRSNKSPTVDSVVHSLMRKLVGDAPRAAMA